MLDELIVEDREGRAIALVEVSTTVASHKELQEFRTKLLEVSDSSLSFGVFIDLENIAVLSRDNQIGAFIPIAKLDTKQILGNYAPEFAGKDSRYVNSPIFRDYFETLVEGWLRDLAYQWKSEKAPGAEALEGTDFLERVKDGMTRRAERTTGAHSLS